MLKQEGENELLEKEILTSHTMVFPSYPALIAIRGLKG